MRIESMSKQEQPAKPLPVDDTVVVKVLERTYFYINSNLVLDASQSLYTSTKELVDKLVPPLIRTLSHEELFGEGMEAAIL